MVFGFLFWLFLIGIVVASLQDLKRREVDNWLNLFLLFAGSVYLLFENFSPESWVYALVFVACVVLTSFLYFYNGDLFSDAKWSKKKYYFWISVISLLFIVVICVFIRIFGFAEMPFFIVGSVAFLLMYIVSNLFYEGRVFAGGDAKLLFAMTAFLVGVTFNETLIGVGVFLLFLMFSGSIYGLLYSFVLYVKDFNKVNKEMKNLAKGKWWIVGVGVVVALFGFFNFVFLVVGAFVVLTLALYVFAKGLEVVSMIRVIPGKDLREGDWLVDDVKVKGKVIKADWDGLSLEDIDLLKSRKKIKIKDGLPFVPAFLIAFLGYVFLRDWVLGFMTGLV